MATAVIMPRQGQSVESCILTDVKVKKGDTVSPGDLIFAYETDKAAFEEEARVAGEVLEVFFAEGDEVPVLANVMVIGAAGESTTEFLNCGVEVSPTRTKVDIFEAVPEPSQTGQTGGQAPAPAVHEFPPTGSKNSAVSPRAKALACKHGIDTDSLEGSGPAGRVLERDVRAAVEGSSRTTPLARVMIREGATTPTTGSGLGGMVRSGDVQAKDNADNFCSPASSVVPLSNMRKLIARAMHASLQNSAQLTHHMGADARRMLELRKKAKAAGQEMTINDLVCWAVVRALEKYPAVNAHFLGEKEGIRRFAGVHLALAVDTERGLMVPVVKDADKMSPGRLATSLREVAESCRKGSINPDLLSSQAASFTVSNLGNYGVEMFTPIVNLPQVAILGVDTIAPRPKELESGVYGFVPYIGLSLTYDHRAIDGGEATRFLKQIATEIENLDI